MREILQLPPIHGLNQQELEQLAKSNKFQISVQHLKAFNCKTLLLIDQLWEVHSNRHFGFSVQNEIYTNLSENWVEFGKKVGWHINGKWIDSYREYKNHNDIPRGHYPLDVIGGNNWDESKEWFKSLGERLSHCKKSHPEFR